MWRLLLRTLLFTMLVPVVVIALVPAFIIGIGRLVPPAPLTSLQYLGAGAFVIGVGVYLYCATDFLFVGRGTPAPYAPPRELVIRGLYRYVRNPMYVGGLIALLGEALVYHTVRIVAYELVVFAMWHWFVVTYEEPALTRLFGETYVQYCAMVARWVPRVIAAA